MKERPILFSGPMVRAILDGIKTQTRRVVKPELLPFIDVERDGTFTVDSLTSIEGRGMDFVKVGDVCPYGLPGDRLWVREAWRVAECYDGMTGKQLEGKLTERNVQYEALPDKYKWLGPVQGRYRHARFMPRWACRLELEITGIRVERLQDISEADARAEGVQLCFTQQECDTTVGLIGTKAEKHGYRNYLWHGLYGNYGMGNAKSDAWPYQYSNYDDPRGSYSSLWESINGSGSWAENPWVWVKEFRRVQP